MSKKENEVKIEMLTEELNPKTLTYRCFEAILIKHGILKRDDKEQIKMNCCQFRPTTKESFSIVNHCSNMG